METKVWIVDNLKNLSLSYPQIAQAAAKLRENEVVAFPTETVYQALAPTPDRILLWVRFMKRRADRAIIH